MNRMLAYVATATLTLLVLAGCAPASGNELPASAVNSGAYQKISAEEAKSKMEAGDVIVLDVRTEEEFNEGHVPGAIRLEAEDFPDRAADVLPDKNAVILVYCRSGNRSRTASLLLNDMGYVNVYDFGGIRDWPYETSAA